MQKGTAMNTCEHCGADAVDSRGVCALCGWHASQGPTPDAGSSPSLGATRVASVGDYALAKGEYSRAPIRNEVGKGGNGSIPPPLELRQSDPRSSLRTQSRFCGACGARLGNDEVFCGQCGTPVGTSGGGETLQGRNPAGGRLYGLSPDEAWSPVENDARTEAYSYAAHARGPLAAEAPNVLYRPNDFGSARQTMSASRSGESLRTMRLVVGVICLAVSLMSAALAILLAR